MTPSATRTKEIVLELENHPGTLGQLTQLLGKEHINILGFAAVAQGDKGTLHLVTDDPASAEEVLEETGYVPRTRPAILASLPNEPGEFGRASNKLGQNGINIEASFISSDPAGTELRCTFSVDDPEAALEVLNGL